MTTVLVISEYKETQDVIRASFQPDFQITAAADIESAFKIISKNHPGFIFTDIKFIKEPVSGSAGKSGWMLERLWSLSPRSEVIVMSSKEMIRDAVKAVKAGASEFITYPITQEEVRYALDSIHQYTSLQVELEYLRGQFWDADSLEFIQTQHPEMKKVFEKIRLVAPTKATVLLSGETGTGKGVLANLIHHHSNRKGRRFIEVHCGAIPDNLVESELFGHEKGAFTGAVKQKLGKFETAHEGTIFLDEVGTLTPSAQIKLLKVLQNGTFQRVGGEETIEVDVRIISASNLDLKKACENGLFRLDLYHRLNVFAVHVPSLKERIDDIPFFVELFLRRLEKKEHKGVHGIHPNVMEAFRNHSWPGNIRELENLLERAYILGRPPMLTDEDFPEEIMGASRPQAAQRDKSHPSLAEVRSMAANAAENIYLRELLSRHKGKIKESAAEACVTTRQLNKLMVKHKMNKREFKPHP